MRGCFFLSITVLLFHLLSQLHAGCRSTFRGEFWIQAQIHQNTIATEVHYSPRAELRILL
uniref:Uncharacterized protein n=1 Tax=Anguilla anguilla TaxID=7936 RepID=A0A0E9V5U0_ANGAN